RSCGHGQGGRVEAEAGGEGGGLGADGVVALEVDDRACDAEDAAVAPRAGTVAVVELVEQAEGARSGGALLAEQAGRHLRVARDPVGGEAIGLPLAGGDDAL